MGWAWGRGPFAAVSLLEYDGLQPILPFLGGRSDAACRVVIKTVGLMVGGAWAVGGGIFALRRPRPCSRCLRGCPCASRCDPDVAIAAASMRVPCRPWKPTFYNRGGMGRVDTRGWAVFCRGLPLGIRRFKPILPFLGGRSDAACRVVMKTVGLHGWKVRRAWDGHGGVVGGGIFALRRPRPCSRRLRGCHCVSHCGSNAAMAAAAMRVPCRPWKTTFL